MRRRDCLGFLVAAAAAWPFAAYAQQRSLGVFENARREYKKISRPSEADRSNYITRLVRLREKAASGKSGDWQVIDQEINRHPAPVDADSKKFSALMVGKWKSPRHEYLYRADGTWTMLPEEEGTTHGTWRIEGNRYYSIASIEPADTGPYTIILITEKYLVFSEGSDVFYETRLK
jgi:hypothetical protein